MTNRIITDISNFIFISDTPVKSDAGIERVMGELARCSNQFVGDFKEYLCQNKEDTMKYIVATDYDGTLRQSDGISDRTIQAIKDFRAKGNLFGVVTGRDYVIGYEAFKKENRFEFDFVVINNGAAAYDKDGNAYFTHYIDGGIPFGTSTLARELMMRCVELTSEMCGMSFEKTKYLFKRDYPMGKKEQSIEYSPFSVLEKVDKFVFANAVCDNEEHAAKVIDALKSEFGQYINPIQNGRCVDVTPYGVDKSTGLMHLAECVGVMPENIWTAGDNYNDIAMLKKYHGCAMSGGVDEAKSVSEHVCDSVADVIEIVLGQ